MRQMISWSNAWQGFISSLGGVLTVAQSGSWDPQERLRKLPQRRSRDWVLTIRFSAEAACRIYRKQSTLRVVRLILPTRCLGMAPLTLFGCRVLFPIWNTNGSIHARQGSFAGWHLFPA